VKNIIVPDACYSSITMNLNLFSYCGMSSLILDLILYDVVNFTRLNVISNMNCVVGEICANKTIHSVLF